MAICAIEINTILAPFLLEAKLTGYVILDHLLSLVLAVVGSTFDVDTVAKMFFDEQNRTSFLFLVTEGCQAAGIDKRALLGEVISEVGEYASLFVLHVARYPKVFFQF